MFFAESVINQRSVQFENRLCDKPHIFFNVLELVTVSHMSLKVIVKPICIFGDLLSPNYFISLRSILT